MISTTQLIFSHWSHLDCNLCTILCPSFYWIYVLLLDYIGYLLKAVEFSFIYYCYSCSCGSACCGTHCNSKSTAIRNGMHTWEVMSGHISFYNKLIFPPDPQIFTHISFSFLPFSLYTDRQFLRIFFSRLFLYFSCRLILYSELFYKELKKKRRKREAW